MKDEDEKEKKKEEDEKILTRSRCHPGLELISLRHSSQTIFLVDRYLEVIQTRGRLDSIKTQR